VAPQSLGGSIDVFRIACKPDELFVRLDRCDCCGAGAHEGVEDDFAGCSLQNAPIEFNRFLANMEPALSKIRLGTRNLDNRVVPLDVVLIQNRVAITFAEMENRLRSIHPSCSAQTTIAISTIPLYLLHKIETDLTKQRLQMKIP